MAINPGGTNYNWNYSKPDKPGYSTQLIGTVLAIQEVQKMGFTMSGQPGAPEFWPDGNPKMNIRLALATDTGELKTFTFQPAGKQARMGQKKSVHMDLFALTGNTDMMNLVGKTIYIQTQDGHYGQGNPRPWSVGILDVGPYQLNSPLPPEFQAPQVLANNAVSGGQVTLPQQAYPVHPVNHQGYQPQPQSMQPTAYPNAQSVYQHQPQPMPMPTQPVYPQQGYQMPPMPPQQPMVQQPPVPQQVPQPYPVEMDPNIAASMAAQAAQVYGDGVNVTVTPPQQADVSAVGQIYDDEMPY